MEPLDSPPRVPGPALVFRENRLRSERAAGAAPVRRIYYHSLTHSRKFLDANLKFDLIHTRAGTWFSDDPAPMNGRLSPSLMHEVIMYR
jgi:hypothetical protein